MRHLIREGGEGAEEVDGVSGVGCLEGRDFGQGVGGQGRGDGRRIGLDREDGGTGEDRYPRMPVREPEGHPGGGRAARQGRGRVREDHGRGQGQGGCGQRLETRQDRCRRDQDPE